MMHFFSAIDKSVLQSLYAARDLKLTFAFIGVTELGSIVTVLGLSVGVALILYLKKDFASIIGLAVAVGGAGITTYLLKHLIHRARPDVIYQAYIETGYSFPSGHATDSAALYGFLAFLILRIAPEKYRKPGALFCAFIILAVAFSRLYLGVHYFSTYSSDPYWDWRVPG